MTRERMYYIAYRICDYMRNREMQNQFENYEICMYVSDLANEIEYAIKTNNDDGLKQYYELLNDELCNLYGMENYTVEVRELINLLDEWRE